MAQAARLNLRMQKELKLLSTDPPPGVSLPLLSESQSGSSSSDTVYSFLTLEARIQGPEGTAYEKGVFNIKIQIPERYPFQPPIVTFVTPIYHPNIDNGGRICLDILNLPPKGAWQPSLNISTVLTSIGLLLSEPNPDDGLMCDASREYKYIRQAFNQKARSWTEKFAMCGARDNGSGLVLHSQNMNEEKKAGPALKNAVDCEGSRKKLRTVGSKLSLDSSVPSERRNNDNENITPTDNEENGVWVCQLSLLNSQLLKDSVKSSLLPLASNCDEQKSCKNDGGQAVNACLKRTEAVSDIPTVIVSDSEESDEENERSTRPKLSLVRKRQGKWRTKACN